MGCFFFNLKKKIHVKIQRGEEGVGPSFAIFIIIIIWKEM